MAKGPQIVRQLHRAGWCWDADIDVAVEAYLAGPAMVAFALGASGYRLDVSAAVASHPPSKSAIASPDRTKKFKRTMVRTAILLARTVEE